MERKTLIVNIGSTSKKYALYSDKELIRITLNIDLDCGYKANGKVSKLKAGRKEYNDSAKYVLNLLMKKELIASKKEIEKIAVRVVSPGNFFQKNRPINREYITKLEESRSMAPLHIEPVLGELKKILKEFRGARIIAVSDSAFHYTLGSAAKYYAIPKKYSDLFGIYRYGYHGISASSVIRHLKSSSKLPERIIICHLGGGCSITAVKNGKSIDTSMGFSPLEGLYMASRSGDIDPSIVFYLLKKFSAENLLKMLNSESGLLGVSGKSSSVKELIDLKDSRSKLAMDMYAYKIKKYIGSYYAALNGLDVLVFTGAVGSGSVKMRRKICQDLAGLGISLDTAKNSRNKKGFIHASGSKAKIFIMETDEIEEMYRIITQYPKV
ncbi:TPA: acetate/propionate family kinase [Candidatus Woesearchaeota archaeon]|nr:Acetate kinase [archaeon GW2011_AR15]MBS3104285.1 acetate/propionate family kinase [Candidatus Woesearchaeota archaeon]HIH41851.1 acetate/propionate family kinase [Candidatus Woesearchaeota archaeon]